MVIKTDILIIGSGAAGLTAAIELSDSFKITVISKNQIIDSSTWYAQGGIAAVLAEEDSTQSHIEDTLKVGDGLCDEMEKKQSNGYRTTVLYSPKKIIFRSSFNSGRRAFF